MGDELEQKLAHIRAQSRKHWRGRRIKNKSRIAAKGRERWAKTRGQWQFFGRRKNRPLDTEIEEAGLSIVSTRQLLFPRFKFRYRGTTTHDHLGPDTGVKRPLTPPPKHR